jgi:hypothetical protein
MNFLFEQISANKFNVYIGEALKLQKIILYTWVNTHTHTILSCVCAYIAKKVF